jgi:hypothetical protein
MAGLFIFITVLPIEFKNFLPFALDPVIFLGKKNRSIKYIVVGLGFLVWKFISISCKEELPSAHFYSCFTVIVSALVPCERKRDT